MDLSRQVCIILFTYSQSKSSPRTKYAEITLASALENVQSSLPLAVHIADDGSFVGHVDHLKAIADAHDVPATHSNAEHRGYGASYNLASQIAHSYADYFLCLEDDWELTRPLNLDPLIEALDDKQASLGCIRLGYLGWTQPLLGEILKAGPMTFLRLDPYSPEPHVWAGHPRLETKAFQRHIGPWPEGVDAGTTEFQVTKRQEARDGVAWPLDLGINASQNYCSLFAHIGAVQARVDQEVK